MSLDELYQELLLDHFKHPRCSGKLENPSAHIQVLNPLCGDQIALSLSASGNQLVDIAFAGHGCSISQASASMMSELCKGKSLAEVRKLSKVFTGLMKGEDPADKEVLGDALALEGVRKFAARIKCALLAWDALDKCLSSLSPTETSQKS